MNRTTNTRKMVESALIIAIATVLIMLNTVPYLSFVSFFAAVPIMVLTARQGLKTGLVSSFAMGILVSVLLGPIWGASALVMYGVSAAAAGYMLKSQMSTTQTILVSALFFAIGFGVLILGSIKLTGTDPFTAINEGLDQGMVAIKESATTAKLSQEDINNQVALVEEFKKIVEMTKPAMILMMGMFLSITNYFMARTIAIKSGVPIKQLTKFRDHRLPSSLLPGILLIVVLAFITGQLGYMDASVIYLNLEVIFMWVFLLQGISILTYIAQQGGKNKERRAVIFIFAGLLLLPFGGSRVIAMLGLFDTVVDIRKLYENRKG